MHEAAQLRRIACVGAGERGGVAVRELVEPHLDANLIARARDVPLDDALRPDALPGARCDAEAFCAEVCNEAARVEHIEERDESEIIPHHLRALRANRIPRHSGNRNAIERALWRIDIDDHRVGRKLFARRHRNLRRRGLERAALLHWAGALL